MTEIIIPPPKIIELIDKVIPAIIKHGSKFEQALLEKKMDQFDFVKEDHPFHAFYLQRLEEQKNKKQEEVKVQQQFQAPTVPKLQTPQIQPTIIPPSFSYKPPPEIGSLQLDAILLAAQYTALYGKEFLQVLFKEQQDVALFDFLKPGKPYFALFSTMVEQYRLALSPSQKLQRRLESEAASLQVVRANLIAEKDNQKQIMEEKKKEEEANKADEENSLYDWSTFKIVQTIDYDDQPAPVSQQVPQKDQVRKTLKSEQKIMQISPITGQEVPIEEFGKHLKYERQHPQYLKDVEMMKERKERAYDSLASGSQIAQNLKDFANADNEPKPQHKYIWDGRQETIQQAVAQKIRELDEEPKPRPELKKKRPVIGPSPSK
ncbi:Surp module family protein [Trichomonas vaginalis G3]|uniref:Surp module family protein n=1 Tax=Trichomonas vaginalis (strain ATCC PRA-98 / G3) TaxID=412133 RepID=A2G4N8_TRIV3|nr:mRNA 3'-splice site recognition [Trichomonas vaginalis G3]EAX87883.1 Surp module family protein [Trichomonas vaginalis G3]KAI5518578.1 mRNA 3'-splice site recognition [Trichomonas vaginalis G3]|eukprot:XP_001300813.1 Surp module family protein [Trichomonas vaginalis G3]